MPSDLAPGYDLYRLWLGPNERDRWGDNQTLLWQQRWADLATKVIPRAQPQFDEINDRLATVAKLGDFILSDKVGQGLGQMGKPLAEDSPSAQKGGGKDNAEPESDADLDEELFNNLLETRREVIQLSAEESSDSDERAFLDKLILTRLLGKNKRVRLNVLKALTEGKDSEVARLVALRVLTNDAHNAPFTDDPSTDSMMFVP
jgi:hypothetical protein